MAITKQQLAALSNEELQEVANMIGSIVIGRKDQRKKDLWREVIKAIAKYEEEIEPITFYCHQYGEDCTIDEIENTDPGNITIS